MRVWGPRLLLWVSAALWVSWSAFTGSGCGYARLAGRPCGLVCVCGFRGGTERTPGHVCSEPSASFGANLGGPRPGALCLTVPTLSTRPQGRPAGKGRNLAFIPVTVYCEETVEAISMGFEHSILPSIFSVPEEVRQHRAHAYEFIHEVLPRTFSPL